MTKARSNLGSFGLKNDSRIVQLSNFEKTVYKGIFNVTREVDYLKQLEKAIIKKREKKETDDLIDLRVGATEAITALVRKI